MKSAIIFLLLLALGAAAFFTKPSQADFRQYIVDQKTHADKGILQVGWDQFQADQFVKACTFNDRIFWISVQKDGQTVYTGAFSHWFNHGQVANDVNKAKSTIHTLEGQGNNPGRGA